MPKPVMMKCITCLLLCFLLSSTLFGQTFGTVTGEVKDATGATVAGATITVRNTATNGIRNAVTNDEGVYTIPALVPGLYDIKAEKSGFKVAQRTSVELQVQQTARVDFALTVGQVSETVEVSSTAPLLSTEGRTMYRLKLMSVLVIPSSV